MLLFNRISKDRLPSWRWWISMSRRNHAAHYQSLRVVSGRTTIILKWLAISGFSTTFDASVIMQLWMNLGRFFGGTSKHSLVSVFDIFPLLIYNLILVHFREWWPELRNFFICNKFSPKINRKIIYSFSRA